MGRGGKSLQRNDCFYKEEEQTVVPGTTVRFILCIVQLYSEAPGKQGDQAA